ncbi:tripartite tricarboxylate transporter TctB family protein [Ancylobacter pratisalsi]|uniref:Tripartite tricarboxylate transporter TctB family protein n=1 Tax=Ancylobacter pratisalsi TaxID=1745854 RepID=A0A6P1YJZ4_9HYPH|nr:tripartite tricarboxylate transporter TctB family protein [Ancylobacter pratisalsi]QIB33707.1 tripartite tricarboxylate transporter TctB family protein [Ancylobacter pratisalsi]
MDANRRPLPGMLSNRIAAVALLGFSLLYGVAGNAIEYSFSSDPLGPRVFPILLAAILALLSLIYLFAPGHAEEWPEGAVLMRCIALPALVLIAALLFEPLGFAASMFIMTTGVARIFGASWKASLIGGLVQAALWYVVFGYLLEVYLPAGELFIASRRG